MAQSYSAFAFRQPAGFAGDISRTHPQTWVEPGLNDATNPVPFYGSAVLLTNVNSYRGMLAGDTGVTVINGIASRPYPIQPLTAPGSFGAVAFGGLVLPMSGEIAIVKQGYVMVPVVGTPVKGGAVFVWVAATAGANVQGGFQAAATGGSTAALTNCKFNGPPDANGIGEIIINLGF